MKEEQQVCKKIIVNVNGHKKDPLIGEDAVIIASKKKIVCGRGKW